LAVSALVVLALALFGALGLGSTPATSVEAMRVPAPLPTTTTVEPTTTKTVALALLEPDLTDLGTTTSSTVPQTTTTEASSDEATDSATATAPPPSGATTTTEPATNAGPSPDSEAGFAARINGFRSDKGHSELTRDGSLDSRARKWAERLAADGSLSHSDLGTLLPPWSAAGENVGTGGSVSGVFDALKASSGHRDNMLGDYTHFGVGVWIDSRGTLWTAHVFTR